MVTGFDAAIENHSSMSTAELPAVLTQILPAVVRFQPDIIFISAGFDAHRKDDLNYRYIGIAEKEYEWVTDQIVQVANR